MKWLIFAFVLFNLYLIIDCAPKKSDHKNDKKNAQKSKNKNKKSGHNMETQTLIIKPLNKAEELPPNSYPVIDPYDSEKFAISLCSGYSVETEKIEKELRFGTFNGGSISLKDVSDKTEAYEKFKKSLNRSITVISGGMGSNSYEFASNMKDRVRSSDTIIYVNWDTLNGNHDSILNLLTSYGTYAHNAPKVGEKTGILMEALAKDGAIDVSTLIGIGHSLGAHVIGNMGHYLAENVKKIEHIIALDAAKPCFENWDQLQPISKKDAKILQVIHTNVRRFGYARKIGHIDIYPNDGTDQPNCGSIPIKKDICNHSYAHQLFLKKAVSAYRSKSWKEFIQKKHDHEINIGLDLKWNILNAGHLQNNQSYYLESPKI
ncbi:phospholipase A1-like [Contarinia nasturtii]|uniref:phospholipase A1-like n=1 Tax=Contarinia nasturtii TaxID=265458 RepID=UPI0012D47A0E|nr:phospholipase A1-like [Contarinia nasturtii]